MANRRKKSIMKKLKAYKKLKLPYKPLFLVLVVIGSAIYFARAYGSVGRWEQITETNAPSERGGHTAVWTGETGNPATANRMIVWGGDGYVLENGTQVFARLNTGGIYSPLDNSWRPTSTANAPVPRNRHIAVWTGNTGNPATANRMIVWGGYRPDGGIYNPATDTWQGIPLYNESLGNGPGTFVDHTAVWTGNTGNPATANRMIIFGGQGLYSLANTDGTGAAIFNPATTIGWEPVSPALRALGRQRTGHTAVWTGNTGNPATANRMIIFGGSQGTSQILDFVYNPADGSVTPLPVVGSPETRYAHAAVWVGDQMVVWGGSRQNIVSASDTCIPGPCLSSTGAVLKDNFTSWGSLSTDGAPTARRYHTAVTNGKVAIIWGGYDKNVNGVSGVSTGGLYEAPNWLGLSAFGVPTGRIGHTAVWTDNAGNDKISHRMIIWGGMHEGRYVNTGGIFRLY